MVQIKARVHVRGDVGKLAARRRHAFYDKEAVKALLGEVCYFPDDGNGGKEGVWVLEDTGNYTGKSTGNIFSKIMIYYYIIS